MPDLLRRASQTGGLKVHTLRKWSTSPSVGRGSPTPDGARP